MPIAYIIDGEPGVSTSPAINQGRRPQPPIKQEAIWLKLITRAKPNGAQKTATAKTPPRPPWRYCANAKQRQKNRQVIWAYSPQGRNDHRIVNLTTVLVSITLPMPERFSSLTP